MHHHLPGSFVRAFVVAAAAFLANPVAAQIAPEHAVVLTANSGTPASMLLDVDLATGKFVTLGRFPSDGAAPLAVRYDPLNRNLVVALQGNGKTKVVRLEMSGPNVRAEIPMGDVPGTVTDMTFGRDDALLFSVGGAKGGVYVMSRNGGTASLLVSLPRARTIFVERNWAGVGMVAQAGALGSPPIDPGVPQVNLSSGSTRATIDMKGYRPLGIDSFVNITSALGHAMFANEDGTIALSTRWQKPAKLNLVPAMPAGGTRVMRLRDYFMPVVLGGKADPRLKTFQNLSFGQQNWQMLSGNLPGDPVSFDLTPKARATVVPFGGRCGSMLLGGNGGGAPRLGNRQFRIQVSGSTPRRPVLLALGVSDRLLGQTPLPLRLPGGCKLYVSTEAVLSAQSNNIGFATQPLPIPNDFRLVGVIVFAQWAQVSGAVINSSDAGAVQIGR